MTDLLDDVIDRADLASLPSDQRHEVVEAHDCDGCGEATSDVNLWAEDCETGEELWLCEACVEW